MSGTRSNPPRNNPAYEADYAQDGYYAVNELSGIQSGLTAPYAGAEGTSGAAEYYYEGQYDHQQAQYPYGGYDEYGRYAEPSTDTTRRRATRRRSTTAQAARHPRSTSSTRANTRTTRRATAPTARAQDTRPGPGPTRPADTRPNTPRHTGPGTARRAPRRRPPPAC